MVQLVAPSYQVASGRSVYAGRYAPAGAALSVVLDDAQFNGSAQVAPGAAAFSLTTDAALFSGAASVQSAATFALTTAETAFAGTVRGMPAWRTAMAPRTWAVVPTGNTLASVNPANDPTLNCNYPLSPPWIGATGHKSILDAYSGPTPSITDGRLFLNGGGHGDYAGNEQYEIDLMDDAPTWRMVRRPSGSKVDVGTITSSWYTPSSIGKYQDGRQRSVHSYADYVHIGGNKIFRGRLGPYGYGDSSLQPERQPLLIDLTTGEHTYLPSYESLATTDDNGAHGGGAAFDPTRNCVWHIGVQASTRMLKTDLATGVTTAHGVKNTYSGGVSCMAYSPSLDLVIYVAGGPAFSLFNPGTLSWSRNHPTTNTFPARLERPGAAGEVWVESLQAVAFWDNNTEPGVITLLRPPASNPFVNAWTWDQLNPDASNTVLPAVRDVTSSSYATYNKFGYLKALKGFYLQSKYAQSMYFFALE